MLFRHSVFHVHIYSRLLSPPYKAQLRWKQLINTLQTQCRLATQSHRKFVSTPMANFCIIEQCRVQAPVSLLSIILYTDQKKIVNINSHSLTNYSQSSKARACHNIWSVHSAWLAYSKTTKFNSFKAGKRAAIYIHDPRRVWQQPLEHM